MLQANLSLTSAALASLVSSLTLSDLQPASATSSHLLSNHLKHTNRGLKHNDAQHRQGWQLAGQPWCGRAVTLCIVNAQLKPSSETCHCLYRKEHPCPQLHEDDSSSAASRGQEILYAKHLTQDFVFPCARGACVLTGVCCII